MVTMLELQSMPQWNELFTSKDTTRIYVLNFWAPWSSPSLDMNAVFAELAKTWSSSMDFIQIEAENFPDLAERFDIVAVPSFLFVQNNQVLERIDGANAAQLTLTVEHMAKKAQSQAGIRIIPPTSGSQTQDLTARLQKLTTMADVVLFMKGTPSEPKCGFSRQVVALLKDASIRFSSFDILADEQVRQSLKTFANWPTYPQLWVRGELVGGLDIVKDMLETGDLQAMLPKPPVDQKGDGSPERLRALIQRAPLMVFIKGTPEEPRCGFSRTLITLLDELDVAYDYFDILQDDAVREGLKTFSNWPTFPQVYVKGELVGGLDIVKELIENGDFQDMVSS